MRSIEATGKTVDEAIFKGLDELGLSIDEVDIEIIDEGGKKLFLKKPSIVRLTERDQEAVKRAILEQEEELRKEKEKREAKKQQNRRDRDQRKSAGSGNQKQKSSGNQRSKNKQQVTKRNFGTPVDGGKEAAFLKELLEKMGIEAKIECFSDEKCLYMRLSGDTMGIIIGRRGETLNAIQYLCSLVANRNDGPYKRIVVDTENYRDKRDQTLVRLAHKKAEEAHTTGKKIVLEPMNPYERRVMHATLQDNPYATTHSEGEEPNRHVVVVPK